MTIKFYFQKLFAWFLYEPIIPRGRTCGFSLVRSEFANSSIGKNTRVYPPFYLHGVSLGDYSYIAKNSNVTNCRIGKFCSIGPNFCCGLGIHPTTGISTSPMFYSNAKQNGISYCNDRRFEESKLTHIGNDVFIGANVTILDGVSVGDGAIIGAGAVVTKDIPPYAIAAGVPAIIKKFRFDEKTVNALLMRRWWDDDSQKLPLVARYFDDVDAFLNSVDE